MEALQTEQSGTEHPCQDGKAALGMGANAETGTSDDHNLPIARVRKEEDKSHCRLLPAVDIAAIDLIPSPTQQPQSWGDSMNSFRNPKCDGV